MPKKPTQPDKPALPQRRPLTVANVREQIAAKRGNYSAVARHFGVERQSVQGFVKDHPELLPAVADARESRVDAAEDKLDLALEDGEQWAVTLVLKTLGKDRGYVEKQELDLTGEVINRLEYTRPPGPAALP